MAIWMASSLETLPASDLLNLGVGSNCVPRVQGILMTVTNGVTADQLDAGASISAQSGLSNQPSDSSCTVLDEEMIQRFRWADPGRSAEPAASGGYAFALQIPACLPYEELADSVRAKDHNPLAAATAFGESSAMAAGRLRWRPRFSAKLPQSPTAVRPWALQRMRTRGDLAPGTQRLMAQFASRRPAGSLRSNGLSCDD